MTSWIPEITDERLEDLASRIKPIVNASYIEPVDLRSMSYISDPKITGPAEDLIPLRDITTYHTHGYYGFFKPSIAEVLAQIPLDLVEEVVAFQIIKSPQNMDDLRVQWDIIETGHHAATTRLYRAVL